MRYKGYSKRRTRPETAGEPGGTWARENDRRRGRDGGRQLQEKKGDEGEKRIEDSRLLIGLRIARFLFQVPASVIVLPSQWAHLAFKTTVAEGNLVNMLVS